ncbi:hypothetical protein FOZ61_007073 [Perkinsus olseni]|uniref:Potassium channel inwardly rectifying transmembrane domain-containing protein n=1 Tax=Perkinsus olseni TaxID=32597 RepID=A0A7J6LAM0_PEROL|nr:hypothetical protein FOZ61_007073 [Perkinsus olseni]
MAFNLLTQLLFGRRDKYSGGVFTLPRCLGVPFTPSKPTDTAEPIRTSRVKSRCEWFWTESFVICYLRDHYGLFDFPPGFWDERDPQENALARRSRLLYLLTHDLTPPLDDALFMEDVDNDAILSFLAGRGFIYLEAIEADGTICSFGVYLLSAWRAYRAKMAMLAFPGSGEIAMLAASVSWQWRSFATKRSAKPRQRVFDMKARCAYRAIEEEFRALRLDRGLVFRGGETFYLSRLPCMTSPLLVPHHHSSSCRPSSRDPLALPLLKEEEEEDLERGGTDRSDADSIPLVSTVSSAVVETTREGTPEPSAIKWHYQERSYSTTSPFMPGRVPNLRSAAIGQSLATQPSSPEASSPEGGRASRPHLRHQQTFPLPSGHVASEVSSLKTTPIPVCAAVEDCTEAQEWARLFYLYFYLDIGVGMLNDDDEALWSWIALAGPARLKVAHVGGRGQDRGDRRSLISARGNLNVHRLIPYITKVYLNWLYDTFPSIIRLKWHTIFFLVIIIYIIVILLYALCFWSFDSNFLCTKDVHDLGDYFFFVQTLFTIGYGGKEPLCFATNVGVTIISILGLLQHTALTGIVFAKFTLDSSRDLACAFSTRLFAIPPGEDSFTGLGGMDSDRLQSVAADSEHVKLCFRFVNVFHRHFFHVSMRLFLVEHHPASEDNWSCPTVQELHYFDTSIPLEFMSLPVEVCAYIPIERLPLLHQADVLDDDDEEGDGGQEGTMEDGAVAGTPAGGRSILAAAVNNCPASTSTVGQHFWVRHFSSEHYKVARQVSGAPPPPPPTIPAPNIWPSTVTPRSATHGGDPMTPQRETPRQSYAASSARSSCLKEAASSFELVCTLEFTDATTGHEISAKKSWPLTDVTWLPPGTDISLCWMSIVQRVGNTGVYNVDVSNLDSIASYDYESSASGQSSREEGSSISYSLQSPRDPVDFSTPSPAFNSDTSPVNHVPRPTVSRVWSTAATAEAAKDEQLPDSAWSIRLGTYRMDSETSPERENDKGSKRESGRFPRASGGVANRWLSAEDPKVLFASKAANDLSQSNATADVTSRSAATVLSTAGSASKRYMRSRTMSNIGDLGSRIPLGIRRQSQRRAFGAGLVDSLD